jgi:hypothetical protein
MSRVPGGIAGTVKGNTSEDKPKRMGDEGSGGLGETEWAPKITGKGCLRHVVGHSQGTRNADNVFGPSTPESLGHFTINELIEVSIVHLW